MLLVSVAMVLEPPLEVLDIPPEEPVPPLEVLDIPPEEPVPPLELLPPELVELPELLGGFELPELLEPLDPLLEVPVFKPGPELPPLFPEDPVPASLVDVALWLLPELLPAKGPVESSTAEPVPFPLAQPGAHPTALTSKANMQPDSLRSNRFTCGSLRREEVAH